MMNFSLGIGRSDQNLVWKTKKILEQRLWIIGTCTPRQYVN
jgi:hypothetical protein